MIVVTDINDTETTKIYENWTRIINDYLNMSTGDPVPHAIVMNKIDLAEDKEETKDYNLDQSNNLSIYATRD
jgi:50S ribosomal subunit-associated GTPase HflX